MSRSYKKIAAGGITTARSDKEYKVAEHRRYRAAIQALIQKGESEFFPDYKGKYGNAWSAPKDGKVIWFTSLSQFLKTTTRDKKRVCQRVNGLLYWEYFERPATVRDWIKNFVGK